MAILVGVEPNMTRVKISYPKPLDDRTVCNNESVRDVFQAPAIALARAVEESNLTRFYPKNVIPYGICYVPLCKRRF